MRSTSITNGLKIAILWVSANSRCFAYIELFNPHYNNPPSNSIFDVDTLSSPILKMMKLRFRDFWRLLVLINERAKIWTKFGLIPEYSYPTMFKALSHTEGLQCSMSLKVVHCNIICPFALLNKDTDPSQMNHIPSDWFKVDLPSPGNLESKRKWKVTRW